MRYTVFSLVYLFYLLLLPWFFWPNKHTVRGTTVRLCVYILCCLSLRNLCVILQFIMSIADSVIIRKSAGRLSMNTGRFLWRELERFLQFL